MRIFYFIIFIFIFLLCFGCSYHIGKSKFFEDISIKVPYAIGDEEGILTKEVICEIASCDILKYKNSKADFILNIEILDISNEKIGYRFDRENDGSLKKNIMPTESRRKIKAKISLFSKRDNREVFKPKIIKADVDYDYVTQDSVQDLSFILPNGRRETILNFSLGQLESIGSAEKAALNSLYKILAKKIVNIIVLELNK